MHTMDINIFNNQKIYPENIIWEYEKLVLENVSVALTRKIQ